MKKITLFLSLCLLSVSLTAQVKKINLSLTPKQSFILKQSSAIAGGYSFIGIIRTTESYVTVDSLTEIITDKDFAVTAVKKFALAQNQNMALFTPETKNAYPALFDLPSFTTGANAQMKISFGAGLKMKELENTFQVTPVLQRYNNLRLDYDAVPQPPAQFPLKEKFGTNMKEETGSSSFTQVTKGSYLSVFTTYLDRGADEGLLNRKYRFFSFSANGELINADSIIFPIKRYYSSKVVVTNNRNEYKGMAYFFTAKSALKMKASDSTDLQYEMLYFDEHGKRRFSTTFFFGTKKFSLVPVTISEDNGSLELLNQHYDDTLYTFRFSPEGRLLNLTGQPLIKKDVVKERPALMPFFEWFVNYIPVYHFTNKAGDTYWLLRRYQLNAAQYGVFEDTYTYGSYAYFKVKADKSVQLLQMFTDANGNSPANALPECTFIQQNDEFCDILVRNPQTDKKVIWRLGDSKMPDLATGINPPATLRSSTSSFLKISDSEYYTVGYSPTEIILSKMVMTVSK